MQNDFAVTEKTRKKHAESGFAQDRIDLLRDNFLCFSNLNGEISVGEARNIFREYEGTRLQLKKRLHCVFRHRSEGAGAFVHGVGIE